MTSSRVVFETREPETKKPPAALFPRRSADDLEQTMSSLPNRLHSPHVRAVIEDPLRTLIPEGEYPVAALRVEVGRTHDREFWAVHFRITDGEFQGALLARFYNPPRAGRRLARRSNLWIDFVALIDRLPPTEGFAPMWMLHGCEVLARVRTVDKRSEEGRDVEFKPIERYSRIAALLRITAGTPPALSGSNIGRAWPRRSAAQATRGESLGW